MRALILVLSLLSVGLLATSAAGFGASARPAPAQVPAAAVPALRLATVNIATSQLHAGYAVVQAKNVSAIAGDWTIPKVHGKCPSSKTEAVYVGISLGGFSTTLTATADTATVCYLGTAQYSTVLVVGSTAYTSTLTVAGGDHMTASISYSAKTTIISVTLKDTTRGTSTVKGGLLTLSKPTDAMWSATVGLSSAGAILPLVDFGNVTFTSCTATINGTTSHNLGHYTSTGIEMVNSGGVAFKAAVGAISSTNKSFTISWKSTGP